MKAKGLFLAASIYYRFVEAKRKNGRVRKSTESTEKYGKLVFRLDETPKTVWVSAEANFLNFPFLIVSLRRNARTAEYEGVRKVRKSTESRRFV